MRPFLLIASLVFFSAIGAAQAAPISFGSGFFDFGKYGGKFDFFDNGKHHLSYEWDDSGKGKDKYKFDDWFYGDDKDCKYGGKDCGKHDHDHDYNWDKHDRGGDCDPGTPTPLPGSMLLFGSAMLGMTVFASRKRLGKS